MVLARPLPPEAEIDTRSRTVRQICSMVAVGVVVAGIGVVTTTAAGRMAVVDSKPAAAAAANAATATYSPVALAVPVPSAPTLAVVAPVTTGLSAFDSSVLDAINQQRSAAGIAPVVEARGIDALALSWSTTMAATGSTGALSHNPRGWQAVLSSGASGRTDYGENVSSWAASPVTGANLADRMMGNASNKGNILDPDFKYVGIGTATGPAGSQWNTITFVDSVDAGQAYDPALKSIPIGQLNSATLVGSTVQVTGWGYDPDTARSPIQVRLTDTAPDGSVVTTMAAADNTRTDVPQLTADTGAAHGLAATLPVAKRGLHKICATLINAGAGTVNPNLGCLPVVVTGPIGNLDSAVITGTNISLAGWALDPDGPTTPTTVTVTDQGPQGTVTLPTMTADQVDVNVSSSIPGVGAAHGFLARTASATVGTHVLCATANSLAAPALTKDLGCITVTVAAPVGAVTDIANTPTSLSIKGWALDPNTSGAASNVRIVVTGPNGPVGQAIVLKADAAGSISSPRYAGAGSDHAFNLLVPITQVGSYKVCGFADSLVDPTASTAFDCKTIAVSDVQGWLDSVKYVNGSIEVRGWALDPARPTTTASASITVQGPWGTKTVKVDADKSRPDVARAVAGAGPNHGVSISVPTAGHGSNTVCMSMKPLTNQTVRQFRCIDIIVP